MDKLRAKVRGLLTEGKVAGYLGYYIKESHPLMEGSDRLGGPTIGCR